MSEGSGKFNFQKTLGIAGIAIFILILLITIYIRIPMLKFYGFYEPDGFFHYSVIRAAVNNHFIIPKQLSISGWPYHSFVGEPDGLYWVTLVPFALLQFFGISYYTVMRLIPVLFGIFDVIGAYYLSRFISKDKLFGLLVMALVALSAGDAARTSALIYRGDGFVTIFLIIALVMSLTIFKKEKRNEKIGFAVLAGISLSITNLVWNGAPFAMLVYMLTFMLIAIASFMFSERKRFEDSAYMLLSMFVWFMLVTFYKHAGYIGSQLITDLSFVVLYGILLISWVFGKYMFEFQKGRNNAPLMRLGLIAAVAIVAIIVAIVGFHHTINEIFVGNGFIVTSSFASTIQELTPPTYSFLYASFGIVLFTTPMSLIITASTLPSAVWLISFGILTFVTIVLATMMKKHREFLLVIGIVSLMITIAGVLGLEGVSTYRMGFAVLTILSLFVYFFLRTFDVEDGWLKGNAKFSFSINTGMLAVMAYFIVTSYLQVFAIRFNSLISIPLAIMSAYTLYWIVLRVKRVNIRVVGMVLGFILCIMAIIFATDVYFSQGTTQADSINPQFINALMWMKNNTPTNSVVLGLWPDGSVIEGVANRTSVTDSVGSQNASKADPFAAWLFNSTSDPQFLTSRITGSPNYLLVRYIWLYETEGIFIESLLNQSTINNYGFVQITNLTEISNSTQRTILANAPGIDTYTAIRSDGKVLSYIRMSNGISPFTNVLFYDISTGNFTAIKQSAFNQTNNQTMLIEYSDVPRPGLATNITGAYVFENGFADTNMFQFLFMCNNYSCQWNNNVAKLQLVYANTDTKIYKIVYNATNITS